VEYRVLGPIEVRVDGRPVAVGGPKPRALLALLLLNAGRVVPTSEVIEALWGGHPPTSGATRVHGVVSELRAALGRAGMAPGPLGTRPHGYLLTPADGELDLDVFERRLAEARRWLGWRPRSPVPRPPGWRSAGWWSSRSSPRSSWRSAATPPW
jgi:DNA-binding SARP family transcriptional activator